MMEQLHTANDFARQQEAITRFFRGSRALYQAFHHASMGQFPKDIEAIEAALNAQDAAAVRRHAHNLKGALGMLGFEIHRQRALTLELAAMNSDLPAAALVWRNWEPSLRHLLHRHQDQD